MFHRILRSLIALATIIVVYQAYVLLAVPWLEPPLATRRVRPLTEIEKEGAAQSVTKYQKLLANYFPADHWSQKRAPKFMGNWPALFVLDDYRRHEDGRVDITQFALLIFPTPLEDGGPAPRDVIILEAPQGARLQFDENFRLERGQIGQIVRGEFPGPITIRSDMHEPGPADDLIIETADLAMNTKLLYTSSPVRFRMGNNTGGGRELEIRFLDDQPAGPRKTGFNVAGLASLEIRRDVRLRVELNTDNLLPDSRSHAPDPRSHALRGNAMPGRSAASPEAPPSGESASSHAARENEEAPAPADITCTGPFQFDFVRYVASFDQNVAVRQLAPDGSGDRMDAQQLDLHFAPKASPTEAAPPAIGDASRRQQADLARLEPSLLVARGQPVVVTSPKLGAEAKSQRIQLELRQRRVTLDGGLDTSLVYGKNVLKAPTIEYWHPAADAGTKVGRFRATGPGSLYYVMDPAKPDEVFQAGWQTSVELGRSNGQPVLALAGRPWLGVAASGSMEADQLTIWFRELSGDRPAEGGLTLPGRDGDNKKSQLVPDRLAANGKVKIRSPNLNALTEQLQATFEMPVIAPAAADAQAGQGVAPAGGLAAAPAGRQGTGLMRRSNAADDKSPPTSEYHVETDRLRLGVRLNGLGAAPTQVECDGHVVFREIPLVPSPEQPLELRGAKLTAVGLDTDGARVKIIGSNADAVAPVGEAVWAKLAGRGMTFETAAVEIDQRGHRLWSDGPGKATVLVTRDLDGRAAAAPFELNLRWENGMEFDGRTATFRGDIRGEGADNTLRCNQLLARLAKPIEFGRRLDKEAAAVREIEFQGQVMINHFTRDVGGPTSHNRIELNQLAINQETGAISGSGPGVIRSTRYSSKEPGGAGKEFFGDLLSGPGSRLKFVRIDFDGRLTGNIHLRELTIQRRVRSVYGPIDSWEQELDVHRPESLPPKSLRLECDELWANEDPVAARVAARTEGAGSQMGPIQLRAKGNVKVDGRSSSGGRFVADGVTGSYDQTKQVVTLEGDGRYMANASVQRRPGDPVYPLSGKMISYSMVTELPVVDGFQNAEFTLPAAAPNPVGPTTSQGPAAPRR